MSYPSNTNVAPNAAAVAVAPAAAAVSTDLGLVGGGAAGAKRDGGAAVSNSDPATKKSKLSEPQPSPLTSAPPKTRKAVQASDQLSPANSTRARTNAASRPAAGYMSTVLESEEFEPS
jgi:hypothetical protein